ncbi:MAG: indole-3-glycerol-phosphate synthase, partial [Chitinophagaceae bacterium]
DFFGGAAADLIAARTAVNIPLLRKDFMLSNYQLYEAKAWGADIVLLIAAILSPDEIVSLSKSAKSLGLNVLLEVHNEAELNRSLCADIDAVGVNNRNLGYFTVDVQTSFNLVDKIPAEYLKISESAISDTDTILALKDAGFDGFLIGENFMKEQDPAIAFGKFTDRLKGQER